MTRMPTIAMRSARRRRLRRRLPLRRRVPIKSPRLNRVARRTMT